MQQLLYIIGFLVTAVGYLFIKHKSDQALLSNTDTKEKILAEDKLKAYNDAVLKVQEEKRLELEKEQEAAKNRPVEPGDFGT